jgi:hypothetical protein
MHPMDAQRPHEGGSIAALQDVLNLDRLRSFGQTRLRSLRPDGTDAGNGECAAIVEEDTRQPPTTAASSCGRPDPAIGRIEINGSYRGSRAAKRLATVDAVGITKERLAY